MLKNTLKDGREPGFYIIDNELIDHYGPTIGVYGVAVYNVLAQYATRDGSKIFPSYQTIADKLGISRPKVITTIALLSKVGLITKAKRHDSAGDMTSNEYTLSNLKGGKQHLPPSKQDLPPSPPDLPRVVNDINQGGKQRLPDLDPVNKTQLNKTQPTAQKAALPPPSSSISETANLTKLILDAYVEVHGAEGINYPKEGTFAKKIAADGGTPELVKGCYAWMKLDKFWAGKRLGLSTIYENLPEYKKQVNQPATNGAAATKMPYGGPMPDYIREMMNS